MQKPSPSERISFENTSYSLDDIHQVIDSFYKNVSKDELLSTPFASVQNWPEHIENLTHFWWIKFGGERYSTATYNPPLKHFKAGFNKEFLDRWLSLFKTSLEKNLEPKQAQTWEEMSKRMGSFLLKRNNDFIAASSNS